MLEWLATVPAVLNIAHFKEQLIFPYLKHTISIHISILRQKYDANNL